MNPKSNGCDLCSRMLFSASAALVGHSTGPGPQPLPERLSHSGL